MRKLLYVIFGTILFITSCIDEPSQARLRIKKQLDSIDNKCPLDMGIIKINGMSMDNDTIVIKYSMDDNYYPVKMMGEIYQKHKEDINTTTYLSFFEGFGDTTNMKRDLILMKASIKYIVSGKSSFDKYEMFINNDEIEKLSKRYITEDERNLLRVKNKLAGEAYRCPYKIEEGMWMDNVYLDNKYITFKINVDENMYSISLLRSIPRELKAALLEEVNKLPSLMAYGELLAIDNCHLGMQYLYVGSESGDIASVKLEPSDMPKLTELKSKVNNSFGMEILK